MSGKIDHHFDDLELIREGFNEFSNWREADRGRNKDVPVSRFEVSVLMLAFSWFYWDEYRHVCGKRLRENFLNNTSSIRAFLIRLLRFDKTYSKELNIRINTPHDIAYITYPIKTRSDSWHIRGALIETVMRALFAKVRKMRRNSTFGTGEKQHEFNLIVDILGEIDGNHEPLVRDWKNRYEEKDYRHDDRGQYRYHDRDRERDRAHDRDREYDRDRERDREYDRDRERDRDRECGRAYDRDRERDRDYSSRSSSSVITDAARRIISSHFPSEQSKIYDTELRREREERLARQEQEQREQQELILLRQKALEEKIKQEEFDKVVEAARMNAEMMAKKQLISMKIKQLNAQMQSFNEQMPNITDMYMQYFLNEGVFTPRIPASSSSSTPMADAFLSGLDFSSLLTPQQKQ